MEERLTTSPRRQVRSRSSTVALVLTLPATAEERRTNHAVLIRDWGEGERACAQAPAIDPWERANRNAAERQTATVGPERGREILRTEVAPRSIVARAVDRDEPGLLDDERVDAGI